MGERWKGLILFGPSILEGLWKNLPGFMKYRVRGYREAADDSFRKPGAGFSMDPDH
jgi:hypothetical protein